MLEWWNGLSLISRVFACIAVPATAVMLLQTILLLIGIGGGGDSDFDADGGDVDFDTGLDLDTDFDADGSLDLDFDADAAAASDLGEAAGHGDGLTLFSIRGIVAFFSIGGWVGFVADRAGLPLAESVILSAAGGVAALFLVAWLIKNAMKLQDNGNLDLRQTLGKIGTAYLPIPPKGEGKGKISLLLSSGLVELDAVNAGTAPLSTGTQVSVCALADATTVVVEALINTAQSERQRLED